MRFKVAPEGAIESLRAHWVEYLIEAGLLGAFMVSACIFGTLYEHPGSPIRQAVDKAVWRGALMGLTMGATAIALIYSVPGKRSGAHFNPATTLTFFYMGKVRRWDCVFYIACQFAGGLAGVLLTAAALGPAISDPHVRYVVTLGSFGPNVAFVAEMAIAFILFSVVLILAGSHKWSRYTGVAAGLLVALYITVEAPFSGMSMNPARTLASAIPAGVWESLWVYFIAPPLGMLSAALVHRRCKGQYGGCAKLHHENKQRCIFCGANGGFEA